MMIPVAFMLAIASQDFPSAAPVVDAPFERFWSKSASDFIDQGVSHSEARQAFTWTLLQEQLGRCEHVTKPADIRFWRNWIRDKRTASIPVLRYLVRQGDAHFEAARHGKQATAAQSDECSITIAALIVEMKR